ncbi:MAG: hypothetical protein ACO1N9_12205 [Flavobacterium sp.]
MKKAALLFLLVGASAFAQSVTLKMGYKPSTTYKLKNDQKTTVSVSYGEDSEPMAQEQAMAFTTITKTGKLTNNQIPFITEMELGEEAAAAAQIPAGTKFYGKTDKDGVPKFDSIHAPGMNPQVKEMLKGMLQTNLSQSMIPNKTVKVGEAFVANTTTDLPMGPLKATMISTTTYKLKKLEGKKAYFDVSAVYKIEGADVKGKGTAMGDMVYDTTLDFPVQVNLVTEMETGFQAQGMDMVSKTKIDQKQTYEITPTK